MNLKQTLYYSLFTLTLLGCQDPSHKPTNHALSTDTIAPKIALRPLNQLSVTGDFDGDGQLDTLYLHHFSDLKNTEMEYAADPFQNEWDTVIKWFHTQQAKVFLTLNTDTLHLGMAQGLYCLINLGDNNADGKEEVALVIDHLDYSHINSCKIYSMCSDQWTLLKQFEIHESAFDVTSQETPRFNSIPQYLEYQHGTWVYRSNSQVDNGQSEQIDKMLPLRLDQCD